MDLLIIGGTRFLGRHLAEAAIDRGHRLTLFHRGQTGADLFPEARRIFGDRLTTEPRAMSDAVGPVRPERATGQSS